MAETMRAAVLYGVDDIRVEEVPMPVIDEQRDVLIRIHSVGICGSDVHFLKWGRIGDFVLETPTIMGHEAAGEVVEVGGKVTGLSPGDRVAVEPGYPCRRCEFCKSGRYNLCPDVVFLAAPPIDGAFAEYLAWPADFVFKLPDEVSLDEGAMLEPLSVGMHAARRSGVTGGDTVAVLGAGPIGLTALQAARAHGATTIIATDMVPLRLEKARALGATHVLDAREVNVEEAIAEMTSGRGVDVVLECAGAAATIQMALRIVKNGGKVQLVGMPQETELAIPIYELLLRELDVSGLFRYAGCYPPSIALVAAGSVDVQSLVTHHFDLDETPEAMEFTHAHKDKVIKAVVHP